jgi:phage N-6-adenine-methyltransferase
MEHFNDVGMSCPASIALAAERARAALAADQSEGKEEGELDNWRTPPEIFAPLHAEFSFDLDAAADADNSLLPIYLDDALNVPDWPGTTVWCNPPYGRMLDPFIRKCAQQAALGKVVVALIPMRTRAAWWHEDVIGAAGEVRCVRKRIRFLRPDGTRAKYTMGCDSCIVVWNGDKGPRLTSWEQGRP